MPGPAAERGQEFVSPTGSIFLKIPQFLYPISDLPLS
jgi:hypothetical protein